MRELKDKILFAMYQADLLAEERERLIEAALAGLPKTQFVRAKARLLAELRQVSAPKSPFADATKSHAAHGFAMVDINRIVPVVAHAVAVFGDENKASHWLATPLALLDNHSPVQMLASGGDVEAIDQILTRIEHNIPS